MEWSEEAILLSARRHGEAGAVATLFARGKGVHAGMVPGGASRAMRGVLQPGNLVLATWRARLSEQLGSFHLDPLRDVAGALLSDAARLSALSSACALVEAALPEREAHPALWDATRALLDALPSESWATVYVHWELALLRELGFGLDLSACAATGVTEELCWVSPKSGRAVSRQAGEPWRTKLLPLPAFLLAGGEGRAEDLLAGLALTGYFLDRHVMAAHGLSLPAARSRLVDRLRP